MRVYMDEHGPEALEPHRTEPIPHGVICSIMGLLRQTATHHDGNGKEVLQIVADDLKHYSLRALVATHMQTGLRKAETTSKTKKMTLKDMTRSNLTWNIYETLMAFTSQNRPSGSCRAWYTAGILPC